MVLGKAVMHGGMVLRMVLGMEAMHGGMVMVMGAGTAAVPMEMAKVMEHPVIRQIALPKLLRMAHKGRRAEAERTEIDL